MSDDTEQAVRYRLHTNYPPQAIIVACGGQSVLYRPFMSVVNVRAWCGILLVGASSTAQDISRVRSA